MDELSSRLESARETIDPAWDGHHGLVAHREFQARARRRQRVRIGVASSASAIAIAVAIFIGTQWRPSPEASAPIATQEPATPLGTQALAVEGGPHAWRFWDGSTATAIEGDGELRVREVSQARIDIDLPRGSARFVVTPDMHEREFMVRAGDVSVHVVGTVFTVAREAEGTRVSVERGRVEVEWSSGAQTLSAGESGTFPPPSIAREDNADRAPEQALSRGWRRLAERGDFLEAYEILRTIEVHDRPEELLLAADAARLSGHPQQASTYLRRLLRDHDQDPRAPLAAFTLGRVLLGQLGRPSEAAQAFARARELSGQGESLAEDALAREVEAWSTAGDAERARMRAEEYIALHPSGQRIRSVRRFGGLP